MGLFLLILSPLFFFFPKILPKSGSEGQEEEQPQNTSTQVVNEDADVSSPQETEKIEILKSGVKEFVYSE